MRKIYAEGHRGYAAKYPENTMISFKAALELGVEIKEYTEENVDLTVPLLTVLGRL